METEQDIVPPPEATFAGNSTWELAEVKIQHDPFALDAPPTKKPVNYYFFKLKDPNAQYGEAGAPRFYPVTNPEGDGTWFVPERYFKQWVADSFKNGGLLGTEAGEDFRFFSQDDIRNEILDGHILMSSLRAWLGPRDCRDLNGQAVQFANFANVPKIMDQRRQNSGLPKLNLSKLKALYFLLADGQRNAKHNDKLTLDDRWGCYYATFDKLNDLDDHAMILRNDLYVKLHSDQVSKLHTPGSNGHQLLQVFVSKQLFDHNTGALFGDKDLSGRSLTIGHSNIADLQLPAGVFWVRDECGRAFKIVVDSERGLKKDNWIARYKKAARSIEREGGWNRCVNPVLHLFIVPVSPDPQWFEAIQHCARVASEKRQTRQVVEVLTKVELDAKPQKMFQLSISPFKFYETWIYMDDWYAYTQAYPLREMPRTSEEIKTLDDIIEKTVEHHRVKSAKASVPFHEIKHEDSFFISLTAEKIKMAVGKRDEVLDQKGVMGIPATTLAIELGWHGANEKVPGADLNGKRWPSPGVWPAEWLHLSAFSWGGLTEDYTTSQIRENLVFGTSECNSLMTRYEKAFQDMVKRNSRIREENNQPDCQFSLCISTHNRSIPIRASYLTDDTFTLNGDQQLPGWLCYALVYRLDVVGVPYPGVPEGYHSYGTVFYPFERGFFTWFEQDLDGVVSDCMFGAELPAWDDELYGKAVLSSDAFLPQNIWMAEEQVSEEIGGNFVDLLDPPMSEVGDGNTHDSTLFDGYNDYEKFTKWVEDGGIGYSNTNDHGYFFPSEPHDQYQSDNNLHYQQPSAFDSDTLFESYGIQTEEAPQISIMNATMISVTPEEAHQQVWESANVKGSTWVDGIVLDNSQLVLGNGSYEDEDDDEDSTSTATTPEPVSMPLEADIFDPTTSLAPLPVAASVSSYFDLETSTQSSSEATTPNLWTPSEDDTSRVVTFSIGDESVSDDVEATSYFSLEASNDFLVEVPMTAKMIPLAVTDEIEPPQESQAVAPDEFVLRGDFNLFGKLPVKLYSLQSPNIEGLHHRIRILKKLHLGTLIPSLETSDLNAIELQQTIITFHSHKTETEAAGLKITTNVFLSGVLSPVNTILREVFGQDNPHISATAIIETGQAFLNRSSAKAGGSQVGIMERNPLLDVPHPPSFTLRGELPGVNISVFGILEVSHLGLDLVGTRKGSAGGYDFSHGFFGQGKIADASVNWYVLRHETFYNITIVVRSNTWTNVGGVVGLNLQEVVLQATWNGKKSSSLKLNIQGVLKLRTGSLQLRGEYSKANIEVAALLKDCTLDVLASMYEDFFGATVNIQTEHTITFDTLEFVASTRDGLRLHGAVTVDGHKSAAATIELGPKGIHILGSVENLENIDFLPDIKKASLDISISKEALRAKFAAKVIILDKHQFEVSIYLNKPKGKSLEYTLYGAYSGKFTFGQLIDSAKGTFLDNVRLDNMAICASNMEKPEAEIGERVLQYDLHKGIQIFAQVSVAAVDELLRLKESTPLIFCAAYQPDSRSFAVDMTLPTEDVIKFDRMRSGKLKIGVSVTKKRGFAFKIVTDLKIKVPKRKEELVLDLRLEADAVGANGLAHLDGMWNNPMDLCQSLSVGNLTAGLGINYATFMASGTPSSFTIGGDLDLKDFKGSMLLHTGTNPSEQLLQLAIKGLDVAQLVSFIGEVFNMDMSPPSHGKDTFFVRNLLVYFSTGMEVNGKYYEEGIELDADIIVLGKNAKMHALFNKSTIKFSGTVDSFTIGEIEVTGVKGKGTNPMIAFELSQSVRKFDISGRIAFGDDYVSIFAHVDTMKGDFDFDFNLVIVDVLVVIVRAKLEDDGSAIPGADKSQIESIKKEIEKEYQIEAEGRKTLKENEGQPVPTSLVPSQPPSINNLSSAVDPLKGKTFTLDAEVHQDILNYIINTVNNHLEKEGDPDRKDVLQRERDQAQETLTRTQTAFDSKRNALDALITTGKNEWETRITTATSSLASARSRLHQFGVSSEQQQRDMTVQLGARKIEEEERQHCETQRLKSLAEEAQANVLTCSRELALLQDYKTSFERALEALDAAQVTWAGIDARCAAYASQEPDKTDPSYAAWSWQYKDMIAARDVNAANVASAKSQAEIARNMYNEEAFRSKVDQLSSLERLAITQEADFKDQEASAPSKVQAMKDSCDEELRQLQTDHKTERQGLEADVTRLDEELSTIQAKASAAIHTLETETYNIDNTQESTDLAEKKLAAAKADVAYRSFNSLTHILTVFGNIATAPLRYLGGKLNDELPIFRLTSMEIKGTWGGKSKRITAGIKGTIGLSDVSCDITWDMTDFADFLRGLFLKIGTVLQKAAGFVRDLYSKGEEVFNEAVENVKKGVTVAVVEVSDFVTEAAKDMEDFGKEVEQISVKIAEGALEFGKDVGDAVGDAAGEVVKFGENVGNAIGEGAEAVGGAVVQAAGEVAKFGEDVGNTIGQGAEAVGDAVVEAAGDVARFGEDVGNTIGEGAEVVGGAVVEAAGDVARFGEEVGGAIGDGAQTVVNIGGDVVNAVDEGLSSIGNAVSGWLSW